MTVETIPATSGVPTVDKPSSMGFKMDQLLGGLGSPGRFQIVIFVCLALNYFPLVFNHVIMAFFGARPSHVCQAVGNVSIMFNGGRNVTVLDIKNSKCESTVHLANGVNQTTTCEGGDWLYMAESRETTIVTEWDLVCDDIYLSGLATTIYFCGVMVGGLLFGYLSDLVGRRPIMLITLYVPIAFGVGISFVPSYTWFVVLRFVQGVLMQGLQISSYVLAMEMFMPEYRPYCGAIIEVFWGASVLCLSGIAFLIRDWRYIQLAISIPSCLAFFYICFVPESLRWLIMKGKIEKAEQLIHRITNFNKIEIPKNEWEMVKSQMEVRRETVTQHYTLVNLFRTPNLRKRSLILFYLWLAIAVGYYGLTFRITSLAGNKYLNFFIGALVEFIAYLLTIYIMRTFGRKKPLITYGFMAAVTCIIAGALPPTTTEGGLDLKMMSTGFAIVGRFAMAGLFSLIFLFTSELYPTVIRNIGMGACAFWARFGGVIAPQINSLGSKTSNSVPIIVFGVMTLIAALLTFFLPETHNRKLPDTLDDVESNLIVVEDATDQAKQINDEKHEADSLNKAVSTRL